MGTKSGLPAALFGVTKQSVLRLLYSQPDRRFYQREIIRFAGLGSGAVQRELVQLTSAGILTRTVEGRQTYFQANRVCPVFEELRSLIRKTFGAAQVLSEGLNTIAGRIRLAFVYGSIAAGSETADSDIDLMIVGDSVSLQDAVSALSNAQREIGREVNPSVYRPEEFRSKLAGGHHFLTSVAAGPKLFLIGDEHELARLADIRVGKGTPGKPAGDRRTVRDRG